MNDDLTYCWLDCDPGHDDSMAILLAGYSKNIKLIGISTVSGNQAIQKVTKNALDSMNLYGLIREKPLLLDEQETIDFSKELTFKDCMTHGGMICPLLQGNSRPLLRSGVNCKEIHGESGLDAHVKLEFPKIPEYAEKYVENLNRNSPHFTRTMFDAIKASPKKVTLIAIGPLTNVALLLINYPSVYDYIEKIVIMGGALGIGNTGPVAEFNIQVDPEAASYVFESDIPIYMVPLEVTHCAIVTSSIIKSIDSLQSKLSKILVELLCFFKTTYQTVFFMDEVIFKTYKN